MSREKLGWLLVYDDGSTEQVYGEDVIEAIENGNSDLRYSIIAVVRN